MNKKEICDQLLKEGCEKINDIYVRSIVVTPQSEYTRLGLSIDKSIPQYKEVEKGVFELKEGNTVFVSAFSIGSLLKDNMRAAFAVNYLNAHPDAYNVILSGAKISVIQEKVAAETMYKNPFSGEDAKISKMKYDTIVNHVVSVELSEFALENLKEIAKKMMGF